MRIAVKDVTVKDMTRLDMGRIRALCFLCAGAMFFSLAPQSRADELGDRLLAAAQKGDAAGVRAVLAKGVDVNTKFRYGTTALLYAAQKGNSEVVRVLLDHGADVNAKETLSGHKEIAELLRKAGAKPPDPSSGFQPNPDVLKDYAGTYKAPDGMEFSF